MKRRTRIMVGLAVWCAIAIASSASAADRGEEEMRTLIPKIVQAWESLDITKVDPFYATDADLAFFDIAPLKYRDWAEYRTGVQKMFFEPNRSLKFRINDDLRVHHRGRVGWATFTFGADVVNKQGANSHLDGRWTLVLEQRKGRWIVLHEHVSVPLGP